jgi:hypothetical protein
MRADGAALDVAILPRGAVHVTAPRSDAAIPL